MADFSTARRMMVDGQIRTSDVTDLRIISAFLSVPRERFVAPSKTALAYLDIDVPVAEGRIGSRAGCSSRWCWPSSSRRPKSKRPIAF